MKLYLVLADDDDGENQDWFVWANDVAEARRLWLQRWMDPDEDGDDDLHYIRRVYEVPTTPPPVAGVLQWASMVNYRRTSDTPEAG